MFFFKYIMAAIKRHKQISYQICTMVLDFISVAENDKILH